MKEKKKNPPKGFQAVQTHKSTRKINIEPSSSCHGSCPTLSRSEQTNLPRLLNRACSFVSHPYMYPCKEGFIRHVKRVRRGGWRCGGRHWEKGRRRREGRAATQRKTRRAELHWYATFSSMEQLFPLKKKKKTLQPCKNRQCRFAGMQKPHDAFAGTVAAAVLFFSSLYGAENTERIAAFHELSTCADACRQQSSSSSYVHGTSPAVPRSEKTR